MKYFVFLLIVAAVALAVAEDHHGKHGEGHHKGGHHAVNQGSEAQISLTKRSAGHDGHDGGHHDHGHDHHHDHHHDHDGHH